MGSTDPKKKTGKKRMTKEERAKKKRNRIILIAVEVFCTAFDVDRIICSCIVWQDPS